MLLTPAHIRSIAIFRALQLGDLLCSLPACRALRAAYPQAVITIIGLPWMKSLPQRFPHLFDASIVFPGYPGLPEQPWNAAETVSFLANMQRYKFDLVLQMQGNGSIVNTMLSLFGAVCSAGFYMQGDYCPDETLYLPYPGDLHEIHRHLALMQHLGIPIQGDQLEFPVTDTDEEELRNLRLGLRPGGYLCIHPGSRGGWRQWPPHLFARLADRCSRRGWQIVLTGTAGEIPIVKAVHEQMQEPAVIAAGKTSLGAVAALIRDAGGLLSNCTGVSHIASALGTKSVIISMDGEPERWKPLDSSRHVAIDWLSTPQFKKVEQAVEAQFLACLPV